MKPVTAVDGYSLPFARGVIYAELASKANSRKLVKFGNRPASIKSEPARAFVVAATHAITLGRMNGTVPRETIPPPYAVSVRATYRSERPDLDPSLLLDALQLSGVIDNDRHIYTLTADKLAPNKDAPQVEWTVRHITKRPV